MPKAAIKLSKGVGIWFRRLGDPDMHGGKLPDVVEGRSAGEGLGDVAMGADGQQL